MTKYDLETYRQAEHAGYEAVAADYDRWLAATTAQFAGPLLDLLDLRPGQRLLDAATGPGVLARHALPRIRPGGTCLGIDFSQHMIQHARTNLAGQPEVEFKVMDIERLDLPAGGFDRVMCGFGLMHFPSAAQALAEMYRVLKPGGRMACSVWAELPHVEFMKIMLDAVKTVAPLAGFPPGPPMFGFGSEAILGPLLATAGFSQSVFAVAPAELVFPSFDAYWNALVLGAARMGGVVRSLSPDAQQAMIRRVKEVVAAHQGPKGITLTGAAFIAAAVRR